MTNVNTPRGITRMDDDGISLKTLRNLGINCDLPWRLSNVCINHSLIVQSVQFNARSARV